MATTGRLKSLSDEVLALARLPGGPCVVALSGGPDSAVCAWIVLKAGVPVRAIHVDHGLLGSPVLRAAAAGIAATLGIDLDTVEVTVGPGPSPEDAARRARYRALEDALEPGETLLTGHTRTDQAETVLGNLLRGAGVDGLSGIPARRGSIERPLLDVSRSQTRELATLLALPWMEDPANLDEGPRRNFLRRNVIPELEQRLNPSLEQTLARTAHILSEERTVLDRYADAVPLTVGDGIARLPATLLAVIPAATAARVVRRALRAVAGPYAGDARDVQAILHVAAGAADQVTLTGGLTARRDRALVVIGAVGERPIPEPFEWNVPGTARCGGWTFDATLATSIPIVFPPNRYVEVFDADGIPPTLVVRASSIGDSVAFRGGHKSVPRVLAEAGVPAWQRDRWPVVVAEEHVVWVPGVRRADVGWIDASTTRYLWVSATREDV
ncbi:MAG: tRNA lysidine(34) synthetase TilS [Acidimicrobiia bacterium]